MLWFILCGTLFAERRFVFYSYRSNLGIKGRAALLFAITAEIEQLFEEVITTALDLSTYGEQSTYTVVCLATVKSPGIK